jgi:hypothetical protein
VIRAGLSRLYVDESGDHTYCDSAETGRRYLTLVGAAIAIDGREPDLLRSRLEELKRRHVHYDPDDPPILHREDIVERKKGFWVLRVDDRRAAFDNDLLE